MQQQLITETIEICTVHNNIVPGTMNDVLPKILLVIGQNNVQEEVMGNVVKSIFYGLWNFDKMINQHNLSMGIAGMLSKMSKKNAFVFLKAMLCYLGGKWNLIDHHRINKFMQLVRYLVRSGLKISQKKTDQVLIESVFRNIGERSGIVDHVTQIYFESICEVSLGKNEDGSYSTVLPYQKLEIFERLLVLPDSLQYFRLHVMEKVYQKLKNQIISVELEANPQVALGRIDEFNGHLLQMAKNLEDDRCRKNLYTLIGYMKSDHELFTSYMDQKREKFEGQKEKRKKKISKFKKAQIRQAKGKRKEKNKQNRKSKIISRPKFEFRAREQMKKFND